MPFLALGVSAALAAGCGGGDPVVPRPASAVDLSAAISVNDSLPDEGDTVTFTITVRNRGPVSVPDATALQTLPTGLVYVSHAAPTGVFVVDSGLFRPGSLSSGAQAVLTVRSRVAAGTGTQVLRYRTAVASPTVSDSVPGNNTDSATVRPVAPPPPPPPPSVDEPTFRTGTDVLIHSDNFDAFATVDARHTQLQTLRSTQGPNSHSIFISDNRFVDAPPASHYELHQIISPGRGGSGRALRSRYLDVDANQGSTWRTWPNAQRYTPDTSTTVVQMHMRVVSVGWQINFPGWKFFEFWHPNSNGRTQVSVIGPAGSERFAVNPASRGDVGFQPAGVTPRWSNIADGNWHRLTWVYKANRFDNDTTGVVRLFVDGVKIVDLSAAGVAAGFCTIAQVRTITALPAWHIQWPDILNTNIGRGIGVIDYDDFMWWVRR